MGAGQYCPKVLQVPGTRGTHTNSSPAQILTDQFSENNLYKHHLHCKYIAIRVANVVADHDDLLTQ